jgi:hypothetical protein
MRGAFTTVTDLSGAVGGLIKRNNTVGCNNALGRERAL